MNKRLASLVLLFLAVPLFFAASISPALASNIASLGLYTTSVKLTYTLSTVSSVTVHGDVVVFAQGGTPAAGASVQVKWTTPGASSASSTVALTDLTGVARFTLNGPPGTYILDVINVAKSGYIFLPTMSVLSAGTSTVPLKGDLLRSSAIQLSSNSVTATGVEVRATVTVRDTSNVLVVGAQVTGFWVAPGVRLALVSGITDASGVVRFTIQGPVGNYIFDVTNVSNKALPFDAAGSVLSRAISVGGGGIAGQ